jgi:hypothetical protein
VITKSKAVGFFQLKISSNSLLHQQINEEDLENL